MARRLQTEDFDDDLPPRKKRDDSLFGWTIFILLLVGIAMGCWMGSFYIFGNPEQPMSYSLLRKLKKIDPPKRFEITAAPTGEFLTAEKLYERYAAMTPREIDKTNRILLRNYLRNYDKKTDLVPYVTGSYSILDSYELTAEDAVPSGVVAIAQSNSKPQVLLEHIFPSDERTVPILQRMLLTGLTIKLERTLDLSAVIHVEKLKDGRIKLTAIPILYGNYASSNGPGNFSLEPPVSLNLDAGFPVLSTAKTEDADKKYAGYRRKLGLAAPGAKSDQPAPEQEPTRLVRVTRPEPVNPTAVQKAILTGAPGTAAPEATPGGLFLPSQPGVAPGLATAKTSPAALSTPAAAASPAGPVIAALSPDSSGPPVAPAVPFGPGEGPDGVANAAPTPTPDPALVPPPIMAGTPAATIANTASGRWETYPAGRMPRGRLLAVPDMPDISAQGLGTDRIYLQGTFIVTASGAGRAVLRAPGSTDSSGSSNGKVRVIVEFPTGAVPPSEGHSLQRDSRRPFLITDVRRSADGQINVYAREITQE